MSERPDYPRVRRIVTGHDGKHVAKVLLDADATNEKYPDPGMISTLLWVTDSMPADISIGESPEDMGDRILGSAPPENGTRFCVIDFPPNNVPVTHRTETLDYVICLEGEIEMDMDESTVTMKAGDILIQRGTNHAWMNRSGARARIAVVLVDAKPLGIGKAVARNQTAASSHA
jgi:quercetin dioxygenase-like cupin family protein